MTLSEIRKRAAKLNVKPDTMSKTELIRAIQSAEGNPACFRTGRTHCDQTDCCWLADCVPEQYAETQKVTGIGARTGKWRR